jgi:hypothetical protein
VPTATSLHMVSPHVKSHHQGTAPTPCEQKGGCAQKEKFVEQCAHGKIRSHAWGKQEGAKHAEGKLRAYSPIPPARTRSIPAARQLREGEGKRGEKGREDGGGSTWNPAASPPHPAAPAPSAPPIRGSYCDSRHPPICASDLSSVSLWCPSSTHQSTPAINSCLLPLLRGLSVSFLCSIPCQWPRTLLQLAHKYLFFSPPLHFISLPSSALPLLSFLCSEVNYIAYACLDLGHGFGYTPLIWYADCAWKGYKLL